MGALQEEAGWRPTVFAPACVFVSMKLLRVWFLHVVCQAGSRNSKSHATWLQPVHQALCHIFRASLQPPKVHVLLPFCRWGDRGMGG